jgi:hypothetical protein
MKYLNFSKEEIAFMKKLNTPKKVQDFLDTIAINFEEDGIDTLKSPLSVFRTKNAHCIEGAILAAYIFSIQGKPALLMNLKSNKKDFDHTVALFKYNGYFGAISKSNHYSLRYREPVYKNIRELALSYFHEYFTDDGEKTLRKYSAPLNLNIFEDDWPIAEENLWGIGEELQEIKYYDIASKSILKNLRKADKIEIEVGKITEYKKKQSFK